MTQTGKRLSLALIAAFTQSADADEQKLHFSIPAQPLTSALQAFAAQSGAQMLYAEQTAAGRQSRALAGDYTLREALGRLLAASGLNYRLDGNGTVTITPAGRGTASAETATLPVMRVVGNAEYDPNDPYNPDYNRTSASTAMKTDTPIMDTPMSVQVIPQAIIRDQQAFRLQDALKNVSGVQQRESNGGTTGGADAYVVRGFELGFRSNYYRNGIRMQKSSADFANLDRVEVLKGPASGLYGRIEAGGLINVVTKKPSATPYYTLEQRFGSYDFYRTEGSATGPLTQNGDLAYRFDFSYLNSASFRDFFAAERGFIAPALQWKPDDRTEINLSMEYLDDSRTYDAGIPAVIDANGVNHGIAPVPISRSLTQQGLADNDNYWLLDFNWTHAFNDNWKIRNGVVAVDGDARLQEVYADSAAKPNGDVPRGAWFGGLLYDTQTVYLDVTGKFKTFGIEHNVLLGGDYYHQRSTDHATARFLDNVNLFQPLPPIDIAAASASPFFFNYIEDNEWYGVYGQDEITLWDNLHIMGGLRYDIATFGAGYSDQSIPLAQAAFDDIEENYLSPRVGISYRAADWLSLYGHYVESFGANNGRQASGKPFDPQVSTEYEGGIKTSFFDGRLTGTLAYYHLIKDNILTPDSNNPGFSVAIGQARSQGLEWDMSGQLTDGLSMIATYAYTDTEVSKDNSGKQGNRLPYVPLHSGSLWLKYDFQQEMLRGFSFGAGIYAAGRRYGDAANSYSDGAYARLDLMAAYRFNVGPTRLTAQLNLNNVTNTQYFIQRAVWSNNPAEPLMAFGSIRLEY